MLLLAASATAFGLGQSDQIPFFQLGFPAAGSAAERGAALRLPAAPTRAPKPPDGGGGQCHPGTGCPWSARNPFAAVR